MARYKEGNVVLSTSAPIIGYGKEYPQFSNALCIVREVRRLSTGGALYFCTTIATGEEVQLIEDEIQHPKGANTNDE